MVRDGRAATGLSQEQLAEAVGRSQEWVGKVENGIIAAPPVAVLREVARVLHLRETDLLVAAEIARNEEQAKRLNAAVPPFPSPADAQLSDVAGLWPSLTPEDRAAIVGVVRRLARSGR